MTGFLLLWWALLACTPSSSLELGDASAFPVWKQIGNNNYFFWMYFVSVMDGINLSCVGYLGFLMKLPQAAGLRTSGITKILQNIVNKGSISWVECGPV